MATETTTSLAPVETAAAPAALNLFSIDAFREAWKVAGELAKSKLIPQTFQNNIPDCIIAMEMAQRIGASIFSVMQSLYIVHGRPGWSAQFIIAALNSCGRFSPLRFDIQGEGDKRVCFAWALEKGTNERLEGPPVSIQMAVKEGWFGKNGSKWQTMPELMLRYRAATFFGRLYAPDVLMGMRSSDEIIEMGAEEQNSTSAVLDDLNKRFATGDTIDASTGEVIAPEQPTTTEESSDVQPKTKADGDNVAPTEQKTDNSKLKAYIREINTKKTSLEIDQWSAKHHKRVANDLGGLESAEYLQVMDYAEIRSKDLASGEQN